jgi:hypothetical protein
MTDAHSDAETARVWQLRLESRAPVSAAIMPAQGISAALAKLIAQALACQRRLLVVTDDDGGLAALANAIDITIRPLCLVLPANMTVQPIAFRASLSLLHSRLGRDDGDPFWIGWRDHIGNAAAWHECLSWQAQAGSAALPTTAALALYPILVLPRPLAEQWAASAEWVVVCNGGTAVAWPNATATLTLRSRQEYGDLTVADPAASRRAESELLAQELADLELELATAQAEVADFTDGYHELVGSRMARLDALQAELATQLAAASTDDLEAGRRADAARQQARRSQDEHQRFTERHREAPAPFRGDGDIRKLFRSIAQKIHPDRARSEPDRAWRTQLMSEANRAYRANDRTALEEVLALWAEGHQGGGELSAAACTQEIVRLKRRIGEIETELKQLFASRLYELYTAAGIARRVGRDLLQEMADRLDADIAAVRAQLACP